MTLKQLFQLESCLSGYSANYYHVEIEHRTKLGIAFNKSKTFGLNDLKIEGSWIVVFAEDKVEQNYLMTSILHSVPGIKYSALMIIDESIYGDFRILINVKEEEK